MLGIRRKAVPKIAVVATAVALLATACGSGGGGNTKVNQLTGTYGSIPAESSSVNNGGIARIAMLPDSQPNWILPIVTSAANSVTNTQQFGYMMWRPLYWTPDGLNQTADPQRSLASMPVYSNGDTTVTIKMKPNATWSNGQPVTAKDFEFTFDVLKAALKESAANWAAYTPGLFPDSVSSITTQGNDTVVLNLKSKVNPSWFTYDEISFFQIMPAAEWSRTSANGPIVDFTNPANAKGIWDYLNQQSKDLSTYGTNPLWKTVDGPFEISGYQASNGATTMVPNPHYFAGTVHLSQVQLVPFTSQQAETNQLLSGTLTAGMVDFTVLPQAARLKREGYQIFGAPDWGVNAMFINFKDKTGDFDNIIAQLYVRQALQSLIDQPGYLKGIFHGAGLAQYALVPAVPKSQFAPPQAANAPYPFSIAKAKQLLSSHGWKVVPGGTDTCVKPGTAANECGAGIPAGTPLSFPLIYGNQAPYFQTETTQFASDAKQAGVNITLSEQTYNEMYANNNDPGAPANENKWAIQNFGGETMDTYPTVENFLNSGSSNNLGDFSDPTADSLIKNSTTSSDPTAVVQEGTYLAKQLPVLFMPANDLLWAFKSDISGPTSSFQELTQYFFSPEGWFYTKPQK